MPRGKFKNKNDIPWEKGLETLRCVGPRGEKMYLAADLKRKNLVDLMDILVDNGFRNIIAITGEDYEKAFNRGEYCYFLDNEDKEGFSQDMYNLS